MAYRVTTGMAGLTGLAWMGLVSSSLAQDLSGPPQARTVHAGGVEYVTPLQLEGPSAEALYAAWPRAARFSQVEGAVDLRCTVTLEGRLKDCAVVRRYGLIQDPGTAALSLASAYRFQPGRRNGAPVPMSALVRVAFVCDSRCPPPSSRRREPAWRATPTPAEVLAAYPPSARQRGVEGEARLDCTTNAVGGLDACRIAAESTPGEGFGDAALVLAGRFRLAWSEFTTPAPPTPRAGVGAALLSRGKSAEPPSPTVDAPRPQAVTIAFGTRIGEPVWMRAKPTRPALGADGKPLLQGSAKARCRVGPGGDLEACEMLRLEPADPAVEQEARRSLDEVTVQTWTDEGRSTIGSSVVLEVAVGQYGRPNLVVEEPAAPPLAPGVVDYWPSIRLSDVSGLGGRYYPDRAQRMEVNGKVVLTCARIVDRRPDGCAVMSEEPLEYGFGEAALKMSRFFRLSPETINGVQTDEATTIPVSFKVPR